MKRNTLEEEAKFVLEEARVIVPGVQALLGFQLVAVFNAAFRDALSAPERMSHVVAVLLVGIAMALVMMPAAFHRVAEPGSVSGYFIRISTQALCWALAALRLGVCIDLYLVARIATESVALAACASVVLFSVMYAAWTLFPSRQRRYLAR